MIYIVAEMSSNHNGSLDTALEICKAAKESGADALKLQTYTPAGMTMDKDIFGLYSKSYTRQKWHEEIFNYCKELDLTCFSTPFEKKDVDLLEELDVPMYKVASFEIVDIPLIEYIAQTGKPIILSTGMATTAEIEEAMRAASNCEITLLKCTSSYPAKASQANLLTIPDMKRKYNVPVGISDHTLGIGVSIAAVALGATMVEKHFCVEKMFKKGFDAEFSLLPEEFALMAKECRTVEPVAGKVQYGTTEGELTKLRRSLWVVKDVKKGFLVRDEHIKSLRLNDGIPPKYISAVLGKKAKRNLKRGEPLKWDCIT